MFLSFCSSSASCSLRMRSCYPAHERQTSGRTRVRARVRAHTTHISPARCTRLILLGLHGSRPRWEPAAATRSRLLTLQCRLAHADGTAIVGVSTLQIRIKRRVASTEIDASRALGLRVGSRVTAGSAWLHPSESAAFIAAWPLVARSSFRSIALRGRAQFVAVRWALGARKKAARSHIAAVRLCHAGVLDGHLGCHSGNTSFHYNSSNKPVQYRYKMDP